MGRVCAEGRSVGWQLWLAVCGWRHPAGNLVPVAVIRLPAGLPSVDRAVCCLQTPATSQLTGVSSSYVPPPPLPSLPTFHLLVQEPELWQQVEAVLAHARRDFLWRC